MGKKTALILGSYYGKVQTLKKCDIRKIGDISYDVFRQIPVSIISHVIAKMLDFDMMKLTESGTSRR